ncbi:MAG: hypothetical protein IKQ91_10100 [Oscillospiraceae bacterium]|nr:hypothetical protein [Oscillospiraceae bacterium]
MKKLVTVFVSAVLSGCCLLSGFSGALPAIAAGNALKCDVFSGRNLDSQNYDRYAVTVKSVLSRTKNGWLRAQSGIQQHDGEVMVEFYDEKFNIIDRKFIKQKLPVFGGFYVASDGSCFLISGQSNPQYDDTVPVFNIAKYNEKLQEVNNVEILGGNTLNPFDGGSLRFDDNGSEVIVRTCHVMYPASDGRNHQANVNFRIDLKTGELIEANYTVAYSQLGYVSHSFNQFIRVDGEQFAAIDHGDAYPRSIVLRTGTIGGSDAKDTDVFTYGNDEFGNNETGVSVGGFEKSSSHYLIAGNTIDQQNFDSSNTRNIFLSTASVEDPSKVSVHYLTDYQEGSASASTPQLCSNGDDTYTVLWKQGDRVCYTFVNGDGTQTDPAVYAFDGGALSDCAPVYDNGYVTWYTWANDTVKFYQINTETKRLSVTVRRGGHTEKAVDTADEQGRVTLECINCGEKRVATVPTDFNVYWNVTYNENDNPEQFSSNYPVLDKGAIVSVWCQSATRCDIAEFIAEFDDAEYVEPIDPKYNDLIQFRILDHGGEDSSFSLKLYPRYNEKAAKSFDLTIAHSFQGNTCEICGYDKGGSKPIPTINLDIDKDGKTGVSDAVLFARFLGEDPDAAMDADLIEAADLDGDGLITILDIRFMLSILS